MLNIGDEIIVYGQKVKIESIENDRIILEHPIVVPGVEYTRDYINIKELEKMKKVKIGDKYVIPSGTQLLFIELQQSLITTKKYVIEVTHTVSGSNTYFFGDLYEILFEHYGVPGLMKVIHGETASDLSIVEPIGDILKPKFMGFNYK